MSKLLDNLTYLLNIVLLDIKGRFKLYATNQTPILIFQMGKVGSTTVVKSLEKKGILPLFHIHLLLNSEDTMKFYKSKAYESFELKFYLERQIRRGEFLYNKIIVAKKEVKIISLTREPIGRNISAFFENFEMETGKIYEQSNFTLQELMDIFINFYHI